MNKYRDLTIFIKFESINKTRKTHLHRHITSQENITENENIKQEGKVIPVRGRLKRLNL